MAVGQWTRKFTWLLDEVEAKGVVTWVGSDEDKLDVQLDPDYAHLANQVNTAGWAADVTRWHDVIHCEAYHPVAGTVNRQEAFSGPPPTGRTQQVYDQSISAWRDVAMGD